jgi:hypothetical protein
MVMSVVITGSPPPSILYSGASYSWPNRSYTAISTAALALEFFSSAPWISCVMRLRLAISSPISRGEMNLRIASMIEPCVSPVITAVAGASP